MNQYQILNNIKKYFGIFEFVDKQVYNKFKEKAWRFFDPRLLENIFWLRLKLGKSFIANTWYWGGIYDERGLRTNINPIVSNKDHLYLSAHLRGAALDFTVKNESPSDIREWIKSNEDKIPYPCRLERNLNGYPISWVHLDVDYEPSNSKVYLFDV